MLKINLNKVKKVYFIGIGGIGVSAVARMLILQGQEVYGSDLTASVVTDELEKQGAHIRIGLPSFKLPVDIDLVIYTIAIPKDHPELEFAKSNKIPTISYPESLALISKDKFTIAVAGTHGKTTTTAMLAQIFIDAGLDPTVIVGSLLKNQKSNFIAGKSQYFIVEACEYKHSFLNLRPKIAVVLNIDADHLDYYGDLSGVQRGFSEFVDRIEDGGILVTDADHPNIKPILAGLRSKVTVIDFQKTQERFNLKLPGRHNIENARAAFAVAKAIAVSEKSAVSSLENFAGTWRRFDYRGKSKSGADVYDDYAHHPTEIRATLTAAKEKFTSQKIIVAFQPHLYSRTKEHFDEFGPVLGIADEIVLLPIYAAREALDATVSSEILVEKIHKQGFNARFFGNFKIAAEYLDEHLKPGDVLFTMGAGDINALSEMVLI